MHAANFKKHLEDHGCTISGHGSRLTATYNGKSVDYVVENGQVAGTWITQVCSGLGIPFPS